MVSKTCFGQFLKGLYLNREFVFPVGNDIKVCEGLVFT